MTPVLGSEKAQKEEVAPAVKSSRASRLYERYM